MLKGRLGLETARVPHADRHGCLWLRRGNLTVENGTLRFITAGGPTLPSRRLWNPVPDADHHHPRAWNDREP